MQPDIFAAIRLEKLVALLEGRPTEHSSSMFMQSEAAGAEHKKRKGAGEGGNNESAMNKFLWSLDTRLLRG